MSRPLNVKYFFWIVESELYKQLRSSTYASICIWTVLYYRHKNATETTGGSGRNAAVCAESRHASVSLNINHFPSSLQIERLDCPGTRPIEKSGVRCTRDSELPYGSDSSTDRRGEISESSQWNLGERFRMMQQRARSTCVKRNGVNQPVLARASPWKKTSRKPVRPL